MALFDSFSALKLFQSHLSSFDRLADSVGMMPIAIVGDEISVKAREPGAAPLIGTVLAVRGEGDNLRYHVRWQDGQETAVFPASVACELRPGQLALPPLRPASLEASDGFLSLPGGPAATG
jgi:hypothetical protein